MTDPEHDDAADPAIVDEYVECALSFVRGPFAEQVEGHVRQIVRDAYSDGRRYERIQIVAWLTETGHRDVASAIERGIYRRGGVE